MTLFVNKLLAITLDGNDIRHQLGSDKIFNWYISWNPLTDLILFLEQLIKLGSNNAPYQLNEWSS